ncbi:DUF5718 family protein [Vibrio hannami]|uniref:DUF5718 family protein n=1 Tax=Vibrio hannami TaxID=2717094 RepID=UPI00240F1C39|nr:DUF5718 family protein [Vibrio hannami]MDG3085602.1 DUF5718 family protein [Vibrio hannami]
MSNNAYIGIIGNYFGHLSGAENVEEHPLPNGIFVIHQSHADTVSSGNVALYPLEGTNVDIEPEFVIRFEANYKNAKLESLTPKQMTIGNDFTIRKLDGSLKISERKAWGEKSKGINQTWWDMHEFIPDNYGKNLNLISYIERDGQLYCATPLVDCSDTKVFCGDLISWIIDRVNNQERNGMYEEILPSLVDLNYPEEIVLYTGAPNYSDWGEANFVEKGDRVHIAAFESGSWKVNDIKDLFLKNELVNDESILTFTQEVF